MTYCRAVFPNLWGPWHIFDIRKIKRHTTKQKSTFHGKPDHFSWHTSVPWHSGRETLLQGTLVPSAFEHPCGQTRAIRSSLLSFHVYFCLRYFIFIDRSYFLNRNNMYRVCNVFVKALPFQLLWYKYLDFQSSDTRRKKNHEPNLFLAYFILYVIFALKCHITFLSV